MILGILFTFLSGITIAQANGWLPHNSRTAFDYDKTYPSVVSAERIVPAYQNTQAQNWSYYRPQSYGYYPNHPPQYPLFYYFPEIKEVKANVTKVAEFRDINDILDQKSEQAIRVNNVNHEISVSMLDEVDNDIGFAITDVSEITSSSLILTARKKQLLETQISDLMKSKRIFTQDREKLQKLLNQFENSKKMSAVDEHWLQKLSEDFLIPYIQLKTTRPDNGFDTISRLKNSFPR